VGQFRSAGGLVLLSGRKLGPQIFLPLANSLSQFFPPGFIQPLSRNVAEFK
jgi:hypothetical protein